MVDLSELVSEEALESGDLGPLIDRLKSGFALTEAERQVLVRILEAVAAGRKGWRDPHAPKTPPWVNRLEARTWQGYLDLLMLYGLPKKVARKRVAAEAGMSERQLYRLFATLTDKKQPT